MIVDEIHEHKSGEAAQANASAKFIAGSPYCLALTGTLIGGYARDLFPLLFRFAPGDMIDEGFKWGSDLEFTRQYGRIEKTVRIVTKFDTGEVIETTDTHVDAEGQERRQQERAASTRCHARLVRQAPDRQGDLHLPGGHGQRPAAVP